MMRYLLLLLCFMVFGCGDPTLFGGMTDEPAPPVANDKNVAAPSDIPANTPEASEECVPNKQCKDVPLMDNRLKYPIVLAHGMAGFDALGPMEYFNGVQAALRKDGFAVYTAVVDPMNGSDVRGDQLHAFIERVLTCTCAEKVNLIAHSQGGIDARYLVEAKKEGHLVESVSTVASPHKGTPLADIYLTLTPGAADPLVDFFAWMIGGLYTDPLEDPNCRAAFKWCSVKFMAEFAKTYPADPEVSWYSYAGRAGLTANGKPECVGAPLGNPSFRAPVNAGLIPGWIALGGFKGIDNDGLVPVVNSRYGEFRGCVAADHLQEIGLFDGLISFFSHKKLYRNISNHLEASGH